MPATRSTRSGLRGKPGATKAETTATKPTVHEPPNIGNARATRSLARSSSNISTYSQINVGGPPLQHRVTARWEKPILKITGLTDEQLNGMIASDEEKSHVKPNHQAARDATLEAQSSEDDAKPQHVTRKSGGRGAKGRGRGRGRGGIRKEASPRKTRPTRKSAPTISLAEVEEEDPSNQTTPNTDAKAPMQADTDADMEDAVQDEQPKQEDLSEPMIEVQTEAEPGVHPASTTPPGSPPANLLTPENLIDIDITRAEQQQQSAPSSPSEAPEPSAQPESDSHTPKGSDATPAESVPIQSVDLAEDVLTEVDLPPAFVLDFQKPVEADCEDRADFLVKNRFPPLTDPQVFIAALTKLPPSARPTEVLYELALNTQEAMLAWQDEYLKLDAKTAPHAHPPKKPAIGGRIPVDPLVYDDMKEADLYNYVYDPKKEPGCQDPFAQRIGAGNAGGRELRQRRNRDFLGSAAVSEDEDEGEGRGSRRKRRPAQRFGTTEAATGSNTPRRPGWGGPRKRGIRDMVGSETPELDARSKRARVAAEHLLPARIREMRDESAVLSDTGEGEDDSPGPNASKRRGRPPGSKNLQKRSDAGIKKGPRKGSAKAKGSPMVLESMSQGQGQFSVDPMITEPTSQSPSHSLPPGPPSAMPHSSMVFQATPQPLPVGLPASAPTPTILPSTTAADNFITTTPLSQYAPQNSEPPSAPDTHPPEKKSRKQRVKSEKRSHSMTVWWAERKARQQEKKIAEIQATQQAHANNAGPIAPPPMTATFTTPMGPTYSTAPGMIGVGSGLAALPSGSPNPMTGPPNRGPMPMLAPAPTPPSNYSPYPPPQYQHNGPVTAPKPKSSAPPPLAPAPLPPHRHSFSGPQQTIASPYPPVNPSPVMGPRMAHQFQILAPAIPPPRSEGMEGVEQGRMEGRVEGILKSDVPG